MTRANEKDIDRLERRHRKLKERVAQYEARLYLTPSEQRDLADLKKEKLATKDQMSTLRQSA
ncbi:MAG: YdcH family protein [Sandaracinaceae bacterium]|nr:YdcH family protein [Sandaracinaceae bacterium]